MLPEFLTISDSIKISVSFHLLCYQLCCSHVLKMVAVVSGQCSWEEGAAGRGHPSKWFESPSQWEKVFISFPVVFFSTYGWELCYSSIPKLIHDESNGTSIHTLAKKDSISWIKFFFPGGLWPHGVGWILKNKTKHTSKWKKNIKIIASLRREQGMIYLVVKAGNSKVLFLLICPIPPSGRFY